MVLTAAISDPVAQALVWGSDGVVGRRMEGNSAYHCVHNDPEYLQSGNPTYHGWPKMAGARTWSVFSKLTTTALPDLLTAS